jgi:hypothetical protein
MPYLLVGKASALIIFVPEFQIKPCDASSPLCSLVININEETVSMKQRPS